MRIAVFLACIALAVARRPWERVSGGTVSPVGSRPYMAALLYSDNQLDQFCGGALIHPQWVLTSGLCVNFAEDVYVGLGFYDILNDDSSDGAVTIQGTWHQHPNYGTSPAFANDIALIKLKTPVTISDRIQTINMPVDDSFPAPGSSMLMTGWGVTEADGLLPTDLSQSVITVSDPSVCIKQYVVQVDDTLICNDYPGQDFCQGDEGGPAVANYDENSHSGAEVITGIAVRGHGCVAVDVPSLYTRVSAHCSWISTVTGADVQCK